MNRKMLLTVLGLGGAYFFLSTRAPVWAIQADGTYKPAGMLDQLTVMLTGAQPPMTKTASTINQVGSGLLALSNLFSQTGGMAQQQSINTPATGITTPGFSGLGKYFDESYSRGIVPRIFPQQR
jgi:hypothetical protein